MTDTIDTRGIDPISQRQESLVTHNEHKQIRRKALAALVAPVASLSAVGWAMTCRAKMPPMMPTGKSAKSVKSAVRYALVDLGVPPKGSGWVHATGMSPNGRYIVGYYGDGYRNRAYRWEAGAFTTLSYPQQAASAWGVNDAGDVVGKTNRQDSEVSDAVLWRGGKQYKLFDDKYSDAMTIDRRGNIYGDCTPEKGEAGWRAYIRDPEGRVRLVANKAALDSFFNCSNEKGQLAIGEYYSRDMKERREVLWTGKALEELPSPLPEGTCTAFGMNDRSEVVGMVRPKDDPHHPRPVLWKNRKPTLLNLPNNASAIAMSINNRGDIVGNVLPPGDYKNRPFLMQSGKFAYLQDLVDASAPPLDRVVQINDQGVILAESIVNDGSGQRVGHAFLLKPVSR